MMATKGAEGVGGGLFFCFATADLNSLLLMFSATGILNIEARRKNRGFDGRELVVDVGGAGGAENISEGHHRPIGATL